MTNEQAFEKFYTTISFTNINLYDDCIVYSIPNKDCNSFCKLCNLLIKSENLPLIAKTDANRSNFVNTVVIEPIKQNNVL